MGKIDDRMVTQSIREEECKMAHILAAHILAETYGIGQLVPAGITDITQKWFRVLCIFAVAQKNRVLRRFGANQSIHRVPHKSGWAAVFVPEPGRILEWARNNTRREVRHNIRGMKLGANSGYSGVAYRQASRNSGGSGQPCIKCVKRRNKCKACKALRGSLP